MKTLVIKQLGGPRIGKVIQNPDGSMRVKSEDAACEQELNLALEALKTETLELRGGQVTQTPEGGMKCATTVQLCEPGDENYLHALADTIMRKQLTVAGHRIRGYVVKG